MKESMKETWRICGLTILSWFGLTTTRQLDKAQMRIRMLEFSMRELQNAQGGNEQACCRHHATPAQKMMQMFVCPECGDKRCNKAEICRLPCNDPSNTTTKKEAFT